MEITHHFSLFQRPMRLMISVSTPEQRSSMVPAAQRYHAEISLCVKTRWVPARSLTVALRWTVIIVGLTFIQRTLGVLKRARGVSTGAPFCRRWATCRRNASLGHNRGLLWPHNLFSHPARHILCGEDKYHKCVGGEFIIVCGGGGKHSEANTERYI